MFLYNLVDFLKFDWYNKLESNLNGENRLIFTVQYVSKKHRR